MRFIITLPLLLIACDHVSSFSPIPSLNPRGSVVVGLSSSSRTNPLALSYKDNDGMDDQGVNNESLINLKKSSNPKSVVELFLENFLNASRMKQATAIAVLMLAMTPLSSNAAMSGGRIGGSFSAPRSSTTRSLPSRSSYYGGGGYSRGAGSGFASGYATGVGAGYMSAPRVGFISPFVSPFFPPNPYYYGNIGGGGAGIITYSPGPTLGQLVFFGGLALAVSAALRRDTIDWDGPMALTDFDATTASVLGPGTSFAKISVAMEVSNRDDGSSILSVLNRLGQSTNTENQRGIQNLTSQVALELLRRKSSIVSATSEYKHFKSRTQAQREFNNQATKERSKFERENTRLDQVSQGNSKATMAVVTLVLAIDGDSTKLPRIRNIADVEESLRVIASDSKMDDCLQSVEILWTPEDRSETLTLKDVIADYPSLTTV